MILTAKLEKLKETLEVRVEEKVSEFRKSIVEIVESVGFEEVAERAGVSEMKEYREVKKLKEECSAKMETLLKLQREVSPEENYQLTGECWALENKAEELKKKGFMEAIEGRSGELKESFIQLIVLKSEAEMKVQSDYLFQVKAGLSTLRIFCLPKKELKTYKLNFTFSRLMGFTHFENCFYLCGGWDYPKYFS